MDEVTLTLSSPMTEEQWDMIADYDFNYTNEITFHTKHGKTVRFVKESAQPEIIRCKDCKWWCEMPLTITRRCSIFNTDTAMTFFCKHGRRENE